MNPKLILPALSIIVLCCLSCSRSGKESAAQDMVLSDLKSNTPPRINNEEKQKIPVGGVVTDSVAATLNQSPTHIDWDKKIIKTATVQLEVKDFKKYNESLHQTLRKFGGYIAQEAQNFTEEKSETVLSIKVPVDQFEPMMNELPGNETKVLERKITSQDVTDEVIDTKSRLEAKKQVRLKYLEFLKGSKNMAEALQVQDEINNIQEEIEAAAGRVQYLSHQSAMSTINLTFFQPSTGYKPVDISPSFLARLANSFKIGAEWLAELMLGLISIWPLILVVFGGIFIYKKRRVFKTNP